jgi:amidase
MPSNLPADLCFGTAVDLAAAIRSREVSCVEVMRAHLESIERVNPKVNAIVTLLPERALASAAEADRRLQRGEEVGPLHGLPIAHKDLTETRGVRTTFGSRIFEDHLPEHDSLLVERLRAAGALMLGKTNVPEFGVGSQTFNEVFGPTRNPYDLERTCGGSSGGAAAALASGMVPIADGSDLGGSLRNPASFCNVVGFRPSPGRVPTWPTPFPWLGLAVEGPMARTVDDTALLLSAMAGPDPRSPIALSEPGDTFRTPLDRNFRGTRIAWASDFGGILPIERSVVDQLDRHLPVLEQLGLEVEPALPDLEGADRIFRTWRAWIYGIKCGPLLSEHRAKMKQTVIDNTELGLSLTGNDLAEVEALRSALYHRMRAFMESYEFLILPAAQVPPFDVDQEWVRKIEGVELGDYLEWMGACYYVTSTGHPAISVPAGFNQQGLPIGMQIVGRHQDDLGVLQLARAFERVTGYWRRRPAAASAD